MTIGAAIEKLRDAYPREAFSTASMRVYAEDLADLDDREVYEAVTRLVRREVRRPTIAAIRHEVAEAAANLPDVSRAWDLASAGTSAGIPEVAASMRAVGGAWSIQKSENPSTVRAQFERDYERRRRAAIDGIAGAATVNPGTIDGPTPIHARKVAQIPVSTRIRPRPVMTRLMHRYSGRDVPPIPADEEAAAPLLHDAISILGEGPQIGEDPLWVEAHRILDEATNR